MSQKLLLRASKQSSTQSKRKVKASHRSSYPFPHLLSDPSPDQIPKISHLSSTTQKRSPKPTPTFPRHSRRLKSHSVLAGDPAPSDADDDDEELLKPAVFDPSATPSAGGVGFVFAAAAAAAIRSSATACRRFSEATKSLNASREPPIFLLLSFGVGRVGFAGMLSW